jgi:hypothetical protein
MECEELDEILRSYLSEAVPFWSNDNRHDRLGAGCSQGDKAGTTFASDM